MLVYLLSSNHSNSVILIMLISVKMILMIGMMMLSILFFDNPMKVIMTTITICVCKQLVNLFSNHQTVFQLILIMIKTLYDRFDQS